jgi:hypothetical protein
MIIPSRPLSSKLVVLIEEEPFLADYIGEGLSLAGAQILGPARTTDEAEALLDRLRTVPLAAVVSANLFDADGSNVRRALDRLNLSVLLVRKDERRPLRVDVRHDVLTLPFAAYQVVDHVCRLLEQERMRSR